MLPSNSLFTDHYEFTMAQGYFLGGKHRTFAGFDYFIRKNPYAGGYTLFAGLQDLLDALEQYRFDKEDCDFLQQIGFSSEFTDYLGSNPLRINVYSVKEGSVFFPEEPVLRVEGELAQVQIVETIVLNILNFESLVATKAARMRQAAGDRQLVDFGLRRAQGYGGIQASRAAVIGGFDATSNVLSARLFDIRSSGTMAHSWIQSFEDELTAFRVFSELNPAGCILLVDTYDTLGSGIPNAIKVAGECEGKDRRIAGIRLDSGDLSYLSKKARQMLDKAGLQYVKIVASNQLDEQIIKSLVEQKAPIDAFGVGTALVTGKGEGALDGVYKLSMIGEQPVMKVSDNVAKMTLPGMKELYRYTHPDKTFYADGICLKGEKDIQTIFHPLYEDKHKPVSAYHKESLHEQVMADGVTIGERKPISEIADYAASQINRLADEHKRFINPHQYSVGISRELMDLRNKLKKTSLRRNRI